MGALAILKYYYSSCHCPYSIRLSIASFRVFDLLLSSHFIVKGHKSLEEELTNTRVLFDVTCSQPDMICFAQAN